MDTIQASGLIITAALILGFVFIAVVDYIIPEEQIAQLEEEELREVFPDNDMNAEVIYIGGDTITLPIDDGNVMTLYSCGDDYWGDTEEHMEWREQNCLTYLWDVDKEIIDYNKVQELDAKCEIKCQDQNYLTGEIDVSVLSGSYNWDDDISERYVKNVCECVKDICWYAEIYSVDGNVTETEHRTQDYDDIPLYGDKLPKVRQMSGWIITDINFSYGIIRDWEVCR